MNPGYHSSTLGVVVKVAAPEPDFHIRALVVDLRWVQVQERGPMDRDSNMTAGCSRIHLHNLQGLEQLRKGAVEVEEEGPRKEVADLIVVVRWVSFAVIHSDRQHSSEA